MARSPRASGPPSSGGAGSWLQLLIGLVGLGLVCAYGWLYRRAPGDDRAMAMVFLAAAALSLVPSWGVVRALCGFPLYRGKAWFLVSLLLIALLGRFILYFLWTMLGLP